MRAMELRHPRPIEDAPLVAVERPMPLAQPGELLLRVQACGVCHTDLHLVEGDLPTQRIPIIPGHQVIGIVHAAGEGVNGWGVGDRVGMPWLYFACGTCQACRRGEENLCPQAEFTGWSHDGGFAEWMAVPASFALPLLGDWSPVEAAPLLCAGIIGYRSLRKADLQAGERLGLIGFGASAHIALQIAVAWNCPTAVFTRGLAHRKLASEMGATWAGGIEDDPAWPLDRAILFAPVGSLVPLALGKLRPGGTLAINAIHLSPIPEIPYPLLYGERTIRSVSNATRQDASDLLRLATEIPIRSVTQTFPLGEANRALADLKGGRLEAAAVLVP
jgi:propanol-preferring alcohol dehydrogenase